MCGIAGIISLKDKPIEVGCIKSMCDVISHRGPDDAGYFVAQSGKQQSKGIFYFQNFTDKEFSSVSPMLPVIDSEHGQRELSNNKWDIFLGHRRLSIIDPSPAGHQPMSDLSKNIWLIYNGEIYNFRELRKELEEKGYEFCSRTDTEVIVCAYMEWGIDCVNKFNGMFAFALWDNHKKELYLARDRYGIKPLYYTILNDVIVFASEIKAVLAYKDYRREVNIDALNEYFTFQNLFRYETMFKDISLLPPANIAKIDLKNNFRRFSYWDYNFTDRNETLCGDIPRLATFTAGFELSKVSGIESSFDERKDAELMANEFKTEHYEQVINAGDLSWAMPRLIYHLEDLRVGMSYPNYYISRLASKFVKVCLSGAGGDELYGGYPWRYYRVFRSMNREDFFQGYYGFWQRLVRDEDKRELFRDGIFKDVDTAEPYDIFQRVFTFNESLKYDSPEDHIANSLYFEIKTFLHGLLIVGDKLSMANSLEERFPFLDNDLVDFAMKIPIKYKLGNLENMKRIDENEVKRNVKYYKLYDDGKNVLRRAMGAIIPQRIAERKKQGFSAPDESWYRGENFQYVRETLLSQNTKMDKYMNKHYVEKTLKEHSEGINHRLLIWSFICFEEWCRQFNM
jgi:asparagine synthase (glutamine-hydrolysing)